MLGLSYDKPATYDRIFASSDAIGEAPAMSFNGDEFKVSGWNLDVPGADPMPVVVAALGPLMLKIAGELADGTNTWMVGPRTMKDHIVPGLGNQSSKVLGAFQ